MDKEESVLHSGSSEDGDLTDSTFTRTVERDKLKSEHSKWYIFDNLSCGQAEELLRLHGEHGTYLISHFHESNAYELSLRLSGEDDQVSCKHCTISTSGKLFSATGMAGTYTDIEGVVAALGLQLDLTLTPIFHKQRTNTLSRSDFIITLNEEEKPPDYDKASTFPVAAKKSLPLIVPVYPTLRRMMRAEQRQKAAAEAGNDETTPIQHGCCWKAFHTDVNGEWFKPHKAGLITGCLLVLGWIIVIIFFGWMIVLALLLVFLITLCACFVNFICMGKCQIGEDEEEEEEGQVMQGTERFRNTHIRNYEGTAHH